MAHNAELMKAIGCHGQWKMKLRTAIECGKIETPVETIRNSDACEFGKWVRSFKETDPSDAEFLPKIRTLHAEFHKIAAKVAELAVQGKQKEAVAFLDEGGGFINASSSLTEAIMAWKSR